MTKGLDIVLKDVSYQRRALGYDVPVKSGCLGWWFLGGDLDYSAINLADGMPDAVVVGAPVVSPHYLSFQSKVNFLRTSQYLPSRWSMIAAFRCLDTGANAATRPVIIGTSDGSNGGGSLYVSNTNSIAMVSYQASDGNEITTQTPVAIATWKMMIACADENGQTLYNMTAGTSVSEDQNPPGEALVPSISPVGIGSGGSAASVYGGSCDVAMAALYDRVPSEPERTAIYDRVKAYLGRRGITV